MSLLPCEVFIACGHRFHLEPRVFLPNALVHLRVLAVLAYVPIFEGVQVFRKGHDDFAQLQRLQPFGWYRSDAVHGAQQIAGD